MLLDPGTKARTGGEAISGLGLKTNNINKTEPKDKVVSRTNLQESLSLCEERKRHGAA